MIEKLVPLLNWIIPVMQESSTSSGQFIGDMFKLIVGFFTFMIVLGILLIIFVVWRGRMEKPGLLTAILGLGIDNPMIIWLDVMLTWGGLLLVLYFVILWIFGINIFDAMQYFLGMLRDMFSGMSGG